MGPVLGLVAVLVLIGLTAFFVAVEFALVAVDRNEVEVQAAEGNDRRLRMVATSLRKLSFNLSGVQLGITICSLGIGVLTEPYLAPLAAAPLRWVLDRDTAETASVLVALLVATAVQMVVGELVPKNVAVAHPLATARFLAPATRLYTAFFRPIIVVFGAAADRFVRLLGVEPREELSQVRSRHELAKLVETSGEEGRLGEEEAQLLTRTFRFRNKTVAEVLTPRTAVVAMATTDCGRDLRERSALTGFSRFPVYGTDLDDVVGLVHVKSLLDVPPERRDEVPLGELRQDVLVVPESQRLDRMVEEMRSAAAYLSVVLDEYGGTAGIVTLEDLLEEIVGEIDDEHDRADARGPVWSWAGTSVLSGRLNLDEVADSTGIRLPEGEYETLAGFVLDRLGRIPEPNDAFDHEGWRFEVLAMDGRRVATVRVVEVPEEAEAAGGPTGSGRREWHGSAAGDAAGGDADGGADGDGGAAGERS